MSWPRSGPVLLAAVLAVALMAQATAVLGRLTDSRVATSTITAAASFDVTPPTVQASVIATSGAYTAGFVRAGGTYHVYANVVDSGSIASGVTSVTADVSGITGGATAVTLVAGSYAVGATTYTHRSAVLTAGGALSEGVRAYSVSATDGNSNTAVRSDLSVSVDNTRPAAVDVQTTNGGTTAGKAEPGDTVTFTFTEPVDPASILAGWNGGITAVVARITDGGAVGADVLSVRNAPNTAQLPVGSVGLGGIAHVTSTVDFGSAGTPSTMELIGSSVVVTLGTASGSTLTGLTAATLSWTPTPTMTDRAGNTCSTTPASEGGSADVDF